MTWTNFKPSTDYIEILPYVGHEGRPGEWQAKLESDELEYFSQAEGCKPVPGSLLDYSQLAERFIKVNPNTFAYNHVQVISGSCIKA